MIEAVKIENFRGIERLEIKGLRRVNLITGKNDCGKTALMEGIAAVDYGSIVVKSILRQITVPLTDFDSHWRLLFRDGEAARGLKLEILANGQPVSFHVSKIQESQTILKDSSAVSSENFTWALQQRLEVSGHVTENQIICDGEEVISPRPFGKRASNIGWVYGRPDLTPHDRKIFSALKQSGKDGVIVDLLREVNDQIRGIELLAPSGSEAELFVRLAGAMPMLPLRLMGDGTQRCFEMTLMLAVEGLSSLYVDEVENGLHHSTLKKLWPWIAKVSASRNVQIFATTHSEECIQAAAHAFTELNDDGLCVIRLDRREHETTAALYDKSLVEASERMGIEIRG